MCNARLLVCNELSHCATSSVTTLIFEKSYFEKRRESALGAGARGYLSENISRARAAMTANAKNIVVRV